MKSVFVMVKWWKNEIISVDLFPTHEAAWDSIKDNKGTCYCQIVERRLPT